MFNDMLRSSSDDFAEFLSNLFIEIFYKNGVENACGKLYRVRQKGTSSDIFVNFSETA